MASVIKTINKQNRGWGVLRVEAVSLTEKRRFGKRPDRGGVCWLVSWRKVFRRHAG